MNFKNYKIPFCYKEKKKYKLFEYPKFKDKKFWIFPKKYNINKFKTLIISGPARNGNHLLLSLIDGHKQISTSLGEDSTLNAFLTNIKKNENKTINKIKDYDYKFVLGLSDQYYSKQNIIGRNKWKKLHKLKIEKRTSKTWSGIQKEFKGHIQDFQDFVPTVNYYKFEKKIRSGKKFTNFFDFWYFYLDAAKMLTNNKSYKIKYPFTWCASGMRRELFFLLQKTRNIKVLCPIREFDGFYYSFAQSRYKTTKIKKKILNEAWEHWYHKVIDYLLLQKKYPNNLYIVKYEDITDNPGPTLKRIANKLMVKFSKSLLTPTILNKKTKGNSSFINNKHKKGVIFKKKIKFNKKILPQEYIKVLKRINKINI